MSELHTLMIYMINHIKSLEHIWCHAFVITAAGLEVNVD